MGCTCALQLHCTLYHGGQKAPLGLRRFAEQIASPKQRQKRRVSDPSSAGLYQPTEVPRGGKSHSSSAHRSKREAKATEKAETNDGEISPELQRILDQTKRLQEENIRATRALTNPHTSHPYSHRFYEILGKRTKLPVWEHREQFMLSMAKNQTMVLVGETGSGKTTQVT